MTIAIKDAPQPADGPRTGRQVPRGANDPGFGDALHARIKAATPKPEPRAIETARWTRFNAELDAAALDIGSGPGPKADAEADADETAAQEAEAGEINEGERAGVERDQPLRPEGAPPPVAFPFPPIHARCLPESAGDAPGWPPGTDAPDPSGDGAGDAGTITLGETREPRRLAAGLDETGEPPATVRPTDIATARREGASEPIRPPAPVIPPAAAAPARFSDAPPLAHGSRSAAPAADTGDDAVPRAEPAEAATPPARVAVLAQQSLPAPMTPTAALVMDAIVADPALLADAGKPVAPLQHRPDVALPTQSLKIQLHPAELGVVTASLRFVGDLLSIELKVETTDAHSRLSADSETIVKALRGLGYEIDRVTVLQPQIAPSSSARPEGAPAFSSQEQRGGEFSGSGANGGGTAGSGGQRSSEGGGHSEGQREPPQQAPRTGGMYI